ncbi:MAG: hypothetical protein KME20_22610 [Kaiparowitsia implicata GSE-PSE-MK54-09C]|jgi:hypothetical protein|nr:hypothetical protein [Kaiparowitsia implicata GSE-PSE-MK54-09C]
MVFAAGSTLHKGAYRIESLLHSDPYSLTLKGVQTESARSVVLQTLNPALMNRAEIQSSALLAQVRDAFLTTTAEVFGPASEATPKLVECFVEQELPVVVVDAHPGQAVPPMIDWLPALELWVALAELSPRPIHSATSAPDADVDDSAVMDQHLASMVVLPPDATLEPLADAPSEEAAGELATLASRENSSASHSKVAADLGVSGASVQSPSLPAIAPDSIPASTRETGNVSRPTVMVAETPSRWRRIWLPSALALTALATGLVGAVVGLGLRGGEEAPLGQLLTKEQSFPSIDGWPGSITAPISDARRRRLAGRSRSEEGFIPLEDEPIYFDSQQRRQSTRIPEPETTFWQDDVVPEPSYQQESAPIVPDYGLDAAPEPRRISPLPNENVAPAPDIAAEEPVLADPAAEPEPIYAAPGEERSPQLDSAPQKPVPDMFQTPPSGESPFVPYEAPDASP